jgi:hypothetical protein
MISQPAPQSHEPTRRDKAETPALARPGIQGMTRYVAGVMLDTSIATWSVAAMT